MAQRPVIEFWYDFASTYSYLSAMRIEATADGAGVGILWRPFLLGPIFAAQGWTSSPFTLFPEKGRYMWRDMEREAAALRIPFFRPHVFPQNSLLAARVGLLGADRGWAAAYTRGVFSAEFAEGREIAEPAGIQEVLDRLGLDGQALVAEAGTEAVKLRLKRTNEDAKLRGIFGAPTFVTEDGEIFWGNDHLEKAIAWALATPRTNVPV